MADHTAVVERVADALLARRHDVAAAMEKTIRADIPAYRRVRSSKLIADVMDQCERHAVLLPQKLRDGRPPMRQELGFARDAATRRVHDGIPLDAFLQAFRAAHGVIWDVIVAETASTPGGRDAAFSLARALIDYFDVSSTQVAEAYIREEQRVHALAARERRDFLESLLQGRLPPFMEGRHPAAPGLDPTEQLVAVVAQVDSTSARADVLEHVGEVIGSTAAVRGTRPLVVVRQGEAVALVAARDGEAEAVARLREAASVLRDRHQLTLLAGASAAFPGFAGVRRGYQEAEHAVARATANRPIVAVSEIPAFEYLLMAADATTRAVLASKSADLALDESERRMITSTLSAYAVESLNITRTATRLGLHPNTTRHRLDRIALRTGRDPRQLDDLLELLCVLRLDEADL